MYNSDLPRRAELPSSRQSLKSTLLAMVVAGVLLVTVVLPAEYGVDPTGVGRTLGLTAMGEIKRSLAQEAEQASAPVAAPTPPPAASISSPASVPAAAPVPAPVAVPAPVPASLAATAAPGKASTGTSSPDQPGMRSDEMTVILKPGEAAEIKLVMGKDAKVRYEWIAQGGTVNYDRHGDPLQAPKGFYHGYGKGRATPRDAGELVAAFDGSHGWFWRNRSGSTVTLTLRTQGAYTAIKRVV